MQEKTHPYQHRLTWLTCHPRHEIEIKKLDLKKNLAKKTGAK
jgi:hypothetical protein